MVKRLLKLAAALSLIVSSGCDNVQWGGADIAVIPPPPKGVSQTVGGVSVEGEHMPQGPVLFFVTPAGTGATIVPIAEIDGDAECEPARLQRFDLGADLRAYVRDVSLSVHHLGHGSSPAASRARSRKSFAWFT